MLEHGSVLCVIHNGHLLFDTLHGSFFALVSLFFWTARPSMFLCGGFTFVLVLPNERARVGVGNADRFAAEHLHVVLGLGPFGPPFCDRCAGLARVAAEVSSLVEDNNHVSAWQGMLVVVIAACGLVKIHFERRTIFRLDVLHPPYLGPSSNDVVAGAFGNLYLHKGPTIRSFTGPNVWAQ